MKKRLTSFLLVLALSFSLSVSASAADDMQYYSLPPVSGEPSVAMDWPVSPASDAQLASIIDILGNISKQITTVQSNQAVLGKMIEKLNTIVTLNGTTLNNIFTLIQPYEGFLSALVNKVATESTLSAISNKVATESTLSGFASYFRDVFYSGGYGSSPTVNGKYFYPFYHSTLDKYFYLTWGDTVQAFYDQISRPGYQWGRLSLYAYVERLAETLASDDDRQLAENYKDNRQQAESDFLSGQSGKTSLGKGDFSNASQVGGALNDTFNMGGAAKVSDFLSGFGSAGTESQAWFSQTTANNLNAVEASDGTQGVSTFADDGKTMVDVDPDPYNMADIFSRYDWLEEVDLDG